MSLLKTIFLLLRLSHWSKSIFVFLGVIYSDIPRYWGLAFLAAFSFCLIASAVYIYNDLRDIEEDKFHPQKSKRPLASGNISISLAIGIMIICLLSGLSLGFFISKQLVLILATYLLINLFYNHWFRKIPFLDVLCIASGFMLRILAGTIGIGLPITWWLTITATLLSLFIALCKRRLEMQLGFNHSHREVLHKYNTNMLELLIASTASGCFISYMLYTIYARDELLYFLWTLPFCALGLWRFAYLSLVDSNNDDPLSLFLQDNLSRLNFLCFSFLTIMALLQ